MTGNTTTPEELELLDAEEWSLLDDDSLDADEGVLRLDALDALDVDDELLERVSGSCTCSRDSGAYETPDFKGSKSISLQDASYTVLKTALVVRICERTIRP